jgi:hypothetical protein
MICGFLLKAIDSSERQQFHHHTHANTLWVAISQVFDHGGPLLKVELFAKILTRQFDWDSPIMDQYCATMDDGVNKIFAAPVPSMEEIGLMVLLYMLNSSVMAEELHSAWTAIMYKPSTSRTNILQQLLNSECDCTNRPTQSFVLAATVSSSKPSSVAAPSSSTNRWQRCKNCNKLGHDKSWCIKPGGGMVGKSLDDVKALRGKATGKGKKNTKFKVKGKTYMVDPHSGTLFAEVSSPLPGASAAIPAENLSSFVADSMCEVDIEELANMA